MLLKKPAQAYDPDYGFCLFRIPAQGARVIWEVTNTCNYGCRYCIFSSTTRQQKDELDTAQALAVIGDLKSAGFTHIKITGGEPFMRPDIMDILRGARAAGMQVDISTNAAYITPEIAAELATLGLEMVHVSLDGPTEELQQAVRGKKTWAPTLDGLKALAQEKIHIRIGCVLYSKNQNALREMVAFCHAQGAAEVIFSRMEPVGRMRGRQTDLLCTRDTQDIQAEIFQLAKDFEGRIAVKGSFAAPASCGSSCGTCPGGEKFLFIDHKGRVSPCTWVSERASGYIGENTLHSHSLAQILNGTKIQNFRRQVQAAPGLCPMQDIAGFNEAEKVQQLFDGNFSENMTDRPRFAETAQLYAVGTENFKEAFPLLNLAGKSMLTVGGSGDQALNAAHFGARHVTAFDVNILSKYFSMLKTRAASRLTPEDFYKFILTDFSFETYTDFKKDLPVEARAFWDKAYQLFGNDGAKMRGSSLFRSDIPLHVLDADKTARFKRNNSYPDGTGACTVDYITSDIEALPKHLGGEVFDVIWLSNIADYAHKMFTGDYLAAYRTRVLAPLLPHLANGGSLVIGYLYDTLDRNNSSNRSALNDPAARRNAFSPPSGFRYVEKTVTGAIEQDNPDALLMWESTHGA